MVVEAVQNYVTLMNGLTKTTREKAFTAARAVLAQAGLDDVATDAQERVSKLAEEILLASKANRELLDNLIATEVDRAASRLGFVRDDEVDELRREVADLKVAMAYESAAAAAARAASAKSAATAADKVPAATAAKKASAATAATKASAATKSPTRKVTAAKTSAAKSAPSKVTPAKVTPAKVMPAAENVQAVTKRPTVKKAPAAKKTPAAKKIPAAAKAPAATNKPAKTARKRSAAQPVTGVAE